MADIRTHAAPTARVGRHRVTGHPAAAVGVRVALVLVTAAVVLLDAPTWLRTALTLLSAVAVTEWVVRHRRRGLLDAALVGAAGLVVAAVLLGLVLDLTPDGLTRTNWAVGAAVLSIGALAAATRRPMPAGVITAERVDRVGGGSDPVENPTGSGRITMVVGVVTTLIAVAVVAVSFMAATTSTRENQIAPLMLASTVDADGGLDLTLSSGTPTGPVDVVVVGGGTAITAATALQLDSTPVTVEVELPAGRVLVNVLPAGSATPIRQLIFDDGQPAAATATTEPTTGPQPTSDPELTATVADGLVTGVTVSSGLVTGPYELVVVVDGRSTVAAGGFYLDSAPRAVPVDVPAVGSARIDLVPAGSTTPVRQIFVEDGQLIP